MKRLQLVIWIKYYCRFREAHRGRGDQLSGLYAESPTVSCFPSRSERP